MTPGPWLRRRVLWPLEAAAALTVYLLLSLLPVPVASGTFGALARAIGPRLGISARARRHIRIAFPDMDDVGVERTVREMWDNLGRTAGEYAVLHRILDESLARQVLDRGVEHFRNLPPDARPARIQGRRVEVVGVENFMAMRETGPVLLFSAHYGNWELLPLGAGRFGLPVSALFRTPNNPWFARVLAFMRRDMGELLPKGLRGAVASHRVMEEGGRLAMLVDQKLNRGIAVPFFGVPAMTAPTLARLAWRYRCPVYGARVERLEGARFRITISPPMPLPETSDEDIFVMELMTRINGELENWIRARPGLWFWLHRRWPDQGGDGPARPKQVVDRKGAMP